MKCRHMMKLSAMAGTDSIWEIIRMAVVRSYRHSEEQKVPIGLHLLINFIFKCHKIGSAMNAGGLVLIRI
jgi:hypothetical protein